MEYYNQLELLKAIRNAAHEVYIKYICNGCGYGQVAEVTKGRNVITCSDCGYDRNYYYEE